MCCVGVDSDHAVYAKFVIGLVNYVPFVQCAYRAAKPPDMTTDNINSPAVKDSGEEYFQKQMLANN